MLEDLVLEPYASFEEASRQALQLLQDRLGMGLWMLTRTFGEDAMILDAKSTEPRYPVAAGDVYLWSESFCTRMIRGEGPSYAPEVNDVPGYRDVPALTQMPIRTYVGVPIRLADGEIFGTLCAIDPEPQAVASTDMPFIAIVGRLLASILDRDVRAQIEKRRAEQAEAIALVDELTRLWNRRAWERFRGLKESRCRRYGLHAAVLSIDLDGLKQENDERGHAAGDELIRRAAGAIASSVRAQDIVARVGGDEFAVLLVECGESEGRLVVERLRANLESACAAASVGFAQRGPRADLDATWARADEEMYRVKRLRKAAG